MKRTSKIGGQALMEGVMMKNGSHYACAVRKPDGTIEVDDQRTVSLGDKYKFFRLPIIRGMVTFVESLKIGIKTLTWSASFFEDEEEDSSKSKKDDINEDTVSENDDLRESAVRFTKHVKKEKTAAEKRKEGLMMGLLVMLSIVFAVGLFMLLPYFISTLLKKVITSTLLLAFIEGVIRVGLFVGYVAAISCMKDIKRVFMYHGAEHKSINCVESGMELNVENVKLCSREHKRCGTSFLLIVMVLSILFFLFIRFDSTILMIVARLLLIPIIAGVSYEFIRVAGNTDNKIIGALSKPGMCLQRLTTREPDDSMIECAIASIEAVFDWRAFQADVRAEEEAELEKKREKREKRSKERDEEMRRRMEAKGIVVEEMSDEKIKAIDAEADKLVNTEIKEEEHAEELAKEAAEKARAFEKELKEEKERQKELEKKAQEEREKAEKEEALKEAAEKAKAADAKKQESDKEDKDTDKKDKDSDNKEADKKDSEKKDSDKKGSGKKDFGKKNQDKKKADKKESSEKKSDDTKSDEKSAEEKSEEERLKAEKEEREKAMERAIKNGYKPVAGRLDTPEDEDEDDDVLNALNKFFKK